MEQAGQAPLPAQPDIELVRDLEGEAGNGRLLAIVAGRDELKGPRTHGERWPTGSPSGSGQWELGPRDCCATPSGLDDASRGGRAISKPSPCSRSLLDDPDPVAPVVCDLAAALRASAV